MSLIEVLMLYEDTFRYEPKDILNPITINIGERKLIDYYKIDPKNRAKYSGYVYSMGIQLDSPYAEILIEYRYKGAVYPVLGSAWSLYDAKLVQPNPKGLFVSNYDEENNNYYVFYTPYRGLVFWDEIKVYVIPTNEPTTVKWYSRLFLIFDKEKIDKIISKWVGNVFALGGAKQ